MGILGQARDRLADEREGEVRERGTNLSLGERQLLALSRALVTDPSLLVCDEPTGDLDRTSANNTLKLLKMLNTDFQKTIFMVTHDITTAAYAGQTLHLDKGQLVEQPVEAAFLRDGRLEDLLIDPPDDRVRPGAIYRAKAGRPRKGQGGIILETPDGPRNCCIKSSL